MPSSLWNEPRLALRVNMRSEWIWELRSRDLHVVNRSEGGFASWEACLADANQHGFDVEPDREGRRAARSGTAPTADARGSRPTTAK